MRIIVRQPEQKKYIHNGEKPQLNPISAVAMNPDRSGPHLRIKVDFGARAEDGVAFFHDPHRLDCLGLEVVIVLADLRQHGLLDPSLMLDGLALPILL